MVVQRDSVSAMNDAGVHFAQENPFRVGTVEEALDEGEQFRVYFGCEFQTFAHFEIQERGIGHTGPPGRRERGHLPCVDSM